MGINTQSRETTAPSTVLTGDMALYPLGASDTSVAWYFKRPDGTIFTLATLEGVQSFTSPAITTSLTTPSTTFALLNTTATTVNAFGGASVALNIGNASGTNTILGATTFSQALATAAINASGVITATRSSDGYISDTLRNSSTGTNAVQRIQIGNNASEGTGQFVVYGSNYTISALQNSLEVNAASGPLRLLANDTLGLSISTSLAVTIPGTVIDMVTSGTVLTVGVGADNGTVSAGVFTDRTKYYEGDALAELALVRGVAGEIDHATLPLFAQATVKRPIMGDVVRDVEKEVDGETVIVKETTREQTGTVDAIERDLGATISMLVVAVQQLTARLAAAGL